MIYAAFRDATKDEAVAALIPAGRSVKVTVRSGPSKKPFEGVAGFRKLAADNPVAMKISGCAKSCCELKPEFDDDRQLGTQLLKVCFDDKRTLTNVEITYAN